MAEHRDEQRRRVLKGALVVFNGRASTMNVVVRDLSEHGCRLKAANAAWIPDVFELSLGQDMIVEQCRVAWRKGEEAGVAFLRADDRVQH